MAQAVGRRPLIAEFDPKPVNVNAWWTSGTGSPPPPPPSIWVLPHRVLLHIPLHSKLLTEGKTDENFPKINTVSEFGNIGLKIRAELHLSGSAWPFGYTFSYCNCHIHIRYNVLMFYLYVNKYVA
jgi:hypothetical protein